MADRRLYPLWAFRVVSHDTDFGPPPHVVMTRGADLWMAREYMARNTRHSRIEPLTSVPIGGFDRYSENHAPGWLYRPPEWTKLPTAAAETGEG